AEIFPNAVRGAANGFAVMILWITNMLVTFLFPVMMSGLGRCSPTPSSPRSTSSPSSGTTCGSRRRGSSRSSASSGSSARRAVSSACADRVRGAPGRTHAPQPPHPSRPVPSPPAPGRTRPMTSTPLSLAVIGAGMAGMTHADAWRHAGTVYDLGLPPVRLAPIADPHLPFAAVIGAAMAGRTPATAGRQAGPVHDLGLPPVRLAAIADAHLPFAEDAAARYGYEEAVGDWRDVAEDDSIDIVSIVVGNALHREIAEAMAAAGKLVLCEKPLAGTLEDAEAMAALEQEH